MTYESLFTYRWICGVSYFERWSIMDFVAINAVSLVIPVSAEMSEDIWDMNSMSCAPQVCQKTHALLEEQLKTRWEILEIFNIKRQSLDKLIVPRGIIINRIVYFCCRKVLYLQRHFYEFKEDGTTLT